MGKRVILTLMEGSFEQGFPVILRIRGDDAAETEIQGKLPPAPGVLELFQDWQLAYRQLVMPYSRIRPKPAQVTNFSCRQLGNDLDVCFNGWLNSGSKEWQKIRDGLQRNLGETEEIQVIIQTEDIRLRRLPWHSWDLFFNHYTKAEIALSAPEYQSRGSTASRSNKVKILAILGDSTGIDVQKDRTILEQLPNAEPPTFLVEPQSQELNDQLWDKQWQILFFAGHSSSEMDGNTGKIYINPTDSLSITDLKNALRSAIERGLQLAIFNSCDGLGLARELADLHIPQIILMREPVPDLVAQEFLKHFLVSFAQGKSLYLAVREARERLQGLENQFPFASWLPIICQNPAEVPLTWHSLRRGNVGDRNRVVQRFYKQFILFLISLILSLTPLHPVVQEWMQSIWSGIPPSHWKAKYFSNPKLEGKPVSVEDLGGKELSQSWGYGAPDNTPVDNFSARITTKRYFAPGLYLIKVKADDGIRVQIGEKGEKPVIDKWVDQDSNNCNSGLFDSEGKKYPVTVEYYEKDGNATLSLDIHPYKSFEESVSGTGCKFEESVSPTEWRSTFFQWNKNQSAPSVDFYEIDGDIIGILNLGFNQRSDGKSGIQQNWGTGSPKSHWGIPANFFVVRSYTQAKFEAGKTYRAVVKTDNGFQLLAKSTHTDEWVYITPKDKWQYAYGGDKEFKFTVPHTDMYTFHFHLYKSIGDASIDLYWEEITPSTIALCSGDSCIGRDPHDNKCDINPDPKIITSTVGNFPVSEGRLGIFKIQLRYSEQCNSTWVWSTAPFNSTQYLEDRNGNKYGQAEVPKDGSPYHFSDMGPGNIELRACAKPPGGKLTCTNFVKP